MWHARRGKSREEARFASRRTGLPNPLSLQIRNRKEQRGLAYTLREAGVAEPCSVTKLLRRESPCRSTLESHSRFYLDRRSFLAGPAYLVVVPQRNHLYLCQDPYTSHHLHHVPSCTQ